MNKFFSHFLSFITALSVVSVTVYITGEKIFDYSVKPIKDSLDKTTSLQNDLESGKIVVFGSSELVKYPNQRFLPQKYFNDELHIPLRTQGNEGHQTFVIMSQLAAYDNTEVRNNARVVILLSPSWFTGSEENGLTMPKFLEYMYPGMMNKLYFQSEAPDKYRNLVSDYIKDNLSLIQNPSYVYKYPLNVLEKDYIDNKIKKFIIEKYEANNVKVTKVKYIKPEINYEDLKIEAKKSEVSSSNNSFGLNDENFIKYIQPEIEKKNFPFWITIPPELDKNQEYQDFLVLLSFLDSYKIKPLFIMQDLHPYIFAGNRENANELMTLIKSRVLEHNFEYYDMWTYKKEDYIIGTLTDVVHFGELGWVRVNQKMIDYFMK